MNNKTVLKSRRINGLYHSQANRRATYFFALMRYFTHLYYLLSGGTDLHLVNLSSLMVINSEELISQWRRGIEVAKDYKHTSPAEKCLYGTLTGFFDHLVIHSPESDASGRNWKDNLTIISTEREKRLGKDEL